MVKWVIAFLLAVIAGHSTAGHSCELRTELDPGDGIVATRIFKVLLNGEEIFRTIYRSEVERFLATDPRCASPQKIGE
jgi:hypothetical protein